MDLKRLLKPQWNEMLSYGAISFLLVGLTSFEEILATLTGDKTVIGAKDEILSAAGDLFDNFIKTLEENDFTVALVVALFWAVIGVISYIVVLAAERYFIKTETEILIESRYVHPKDYKHSVFWAILITRALYRASILILTAAFTLFSFQVLIPLWLQQIESWFVDFSDAGNMLSAGFAFIGLCLTWHVFVVLARLLMLRERVFDKIG